MTAGVRPQAPFGRRSAVVNERIGAGPYVILRALDRQGPRPAPGQFYMLMTAVGWGGGEDGRPYLPRALSFARAEESADGIVLDFLLEAVGPGTRRLGAVEPGEDLLITGPFGNGFSVDDACAPLLVAGGIGLAPIVALADALASRERAFSSCIGMRSAAHTAAIEYFGLQHELATDDGSAGHHGLVTQLVGARLAEADAATVYACGPPAMLEAVRALCAESGAPAQLAMESGMACGFGACHGCVVETVDGYLRLCVDGPVIAGDRLESALALGDQV